MVRVIKLCVYRMALVEIVQTILGDDVPNREGDEVSSRLDVYISLVLSTFVPLNNLPSIPQLSSIRQELYYRNFFAWALCGLFVSFKAAWYARRAAAKSFLLINSPL